MLTNVARMRNGLLAIELHFLASIFVEKPRKNAQSAKILVSF